MSKTYQIFLAIYSLFFVPLVALLLACSYLWRRVVDVLLRIQLRNKYAGLLDGMDSVWAVEESSARSMNNILLILEKDARHSNLNFLESFRDLVKSRILTSPYEKLLYKRRKRFGYYYWERSEEVDLKERVRWLEYERTNCDGSCDNVYNGHLKRVLWNVCNQPLPENHATSWEVLIGKCCPRSSHHYLRRLEERLTSRIKIPVLFRVHHSLGDGMSLLKYFREVIVDKESAETCLQPKSPSFRINIEEKIDVARPKIALLNPCLTEDKRLDCTFQKDVLSASMPFIHFIVYLQVVKIVRGQLNAGLRFIQHVTMNDLKREAKTFLTHASDKLKGFLIIVGMKLKRFLLMAKLVFGAPACLVAQAFRSMDKSALHGAELTGEKLVSYWMEDDFRNAGDQKLFTKIQNIKSITGARFGEVLLAALSVSLHKYFLRMNEAIPATLSVVIPMKVEEWSDDLPLQNNFSVGILPLCISRTKEKQFPDPVENTQILDRLECVKNASDELRNSLDYKVNFLLMKYIAAILPETLLRPILKSHSTMVFSNLVGPQEIKVLGHSLKNIVFWIPNKSYTGIGCSLLTYRGYLHLSLVADKALVPNEKTLSQILEDTVEEIDNLYDRLTLSFFSKKLRASNSTPTKKVIGVL